MKKNIILLAVATSILAVMIVALILLNKAPASDSTETSEDETILITGSYDDPLPESVKVQNEKGSFTVYSESSENNAARLEGFDGFSLDTYALNNILTGARSLAAKRVVDENAGDLSLYGLDKPRATVTVVGGSVILIGGDAPGGEGVYVSLDGSGTVYLCASALTDPFFFSKLDFINKNVTETDPEFSGFDRIVLSGEKFPEQIIIEKLPENDDSQDFMFQTHRIVSPVTRAASQSGLDAVSSAYGLTADSVAGIAAENDAQALEKYGLLNPASVLSLTSGSQALTFTLKVSEPASDGTVYLMKSGSPVVYSLDSSALPWLDLSLFDYMDKLAVTPHIDAVSEVRLSIGGEGYAFSLAGEGDGLSVLLNGASLPDAKDSAGNTVSAVSNFRKLYQTLISAGYLEEAQDQPGEFAKPVVTIEYAYRDGKPTDFVRFYSGAPPRRLYISVNDDRVYLAPSTYLDKVAGEVAKLLGGEPIGD